ncbi:MAG: YsnF/AvaK domain-containing protein [Phycisphaerae bacterium]
MVQPNPNDLNNCPPEIGAVRENTLTIPEIEEIADITKRVIDTGTIRITKHVREVERTFKPTLHDQHIRINRVEINRIVETAPEVRTEGDTTIIPVVEEVVVKLILLKEELHVTRQTAEKTQEVHTTLRREEVQITRETPDEQQQKQK